MIEDKVDEYVRAELWQREMLEQRCGLSYIESIDALAFGVDYHDLESFMHKNPTCSKGMAIAIVAQR